jgi:hypothetical protein
MLARTLIVVVVGALAILLGARRVLARQPAAKVSSAAWTELQTSTFRLSAPPGWALVQVGETDFGLLSPTVVDGFQLNVVFSVFDRTHLPATLDAFVEEVTRAHAAEPSLRERIQSRQRLVVAGHAAERIVSVDQGNLQYMTTFLVEANRGYEAAAVAPAGAFATYEGVFARISDSLELLRGAAPSPPLPQKALLLPAELGGADVPANRTWLYPGAASAKATFDARVRALVKAGERIVYAAAPDHEGANLVPKSVHIAARRPDGTMLTLTIPNRSK